LFCSLHFFIGEINIATIGVLFRNADKKAKGISSLVKALLIPLLLLPLSIEFINKFITPVVCSAPLIANNNPIVNIPSLENPMNASFTVITFPISSRRRTENIEISGGKISFIRRNVKMKNSAKV
jgi:hypothetical protein